MTKLTLGGDRLGTGAGMQVETRDYSRSTHDLQHTVTTTLSPGTIVPFMSILGLTGDTFDIQLYVDLMTHPTIGPLFGSFKVQLDVFECPLNIYNPTLLYNPTGIGMKMETIKIPQIVVNGKIPEPGDDLDTVHINPSSLLRHLGISSLGHAAYIEGEEIPTSLNRFFNAFKVLAYWDAVKNTH